MLREELILMVYENGVLRRMFWPKNEEVVGGWRRWLNEDQCAWGFIVNSCLHQLHMLGIRHWIISYLYHTRKAFSVTP